ncbi:MAG: 50S ribosomal protein L1 [Simkaniaceae bacterium]|nr:50S ribosomal protein L1 [Simkaniaceae bacterium]
MANRSKRYRKMQELLDSEKTYELKDAVDVIKSFPAAKFDESVEIALRIGVDPKKSDQQVRSTVFLPHGTGKEVRVVVLAKGDKAKEALDAGADHAGDAELIEKIKGGWTDFDAVIATPDMMREVGKLGKVLGPRGLMPAPKAGTVTTDVKKAVEDLKKGKIEFKVDKNGVINNSVGKVSFTAENLVENIESLLSAISKVKPATAKGQFLRSLSVASTMGAGLKIELNSLSLS